MLKRWFLGRSVLIYTSAKHYYLIWTNKPLDTPFCRANLRDVTMAVKKCVYVIPPVLTFINLCNLLKKSYPLIELAKHLTNFNHGATSQAYVSATFNCDRYVAWRNGGLSYCRTFLCSSLQHIAISRSF